MDKLYPIVRRVRKPLLPAEAELPRSASFTPEHETESRGRDELHESPSQPAAPPAENVGDSQSPPLQSDLALVAPKETPDDAGADS
jgi:hypothetical protein